MHATGQVGHVDLAKDWAPFRLMEALNWHLKPLPVAITACAVVADDFHARFSAMERRYLFRVVSRRAPLTHDRGLVWQVPNALDAGAMRAAAAHLIGKHDFTTFRSTFCQAESPVKTLDEIAIETRAYPGGVGDPLCPARAQFSAQSGAVDRGHAGAGGDGAVAARRCGKSPGRARPCGLRAGGAA